MADGSGAAVGRGAPSDSDPTLPLLLPLPLPSPFPDWLLFLGFLCSNLVPQLASLLQVRPPKPDGNMILALEKEGLLPCFCFIFPLLYCKDLVRERERERERIEGNQTNSLSFHSTDSVPALAVDQLCVLLGAWGLGDGVSETPFFHHRETTWRNV